MLKICVSGKCDFDSSTRYVCANDHNDDDDNTKRLSLPNNVNPTCGYNNCFGTYDCASNEVCTKYSSTSPLPGEGGLKICYSCVVNEIKCCVEKGDEATSVSECCPLPPNGVYLADGHCCEKGDYWDPAALIGKGSCRDGASCSTLWGVSSQVSYNAPSFSYWLNHGGVSDDACCYFTKYSKLDNWWDQIIVY
jgi:hypothetical protein